MCKPPKNIKGYEHEVSGSTTEILYFSEDRALAEDDAEVETCRGK
jgi:hypothetical protein